MGGHLTMQQPNATTDRSGRPITVGTRVRVLEIPESLVANLPVEERADVESMLGAVFEVYEIDDFGSAWVEKVWDESDGSCSHAIGFAPHEMELA
jgi:hypothetical protein